MCVEWLLDSVSSMMMGDGRTPLRSQSREHHFVYLACVCRVLRVILSSVHSYNGYNGVIDFKKSCNLVRSYNWSKSGLLFLKLIKLPKSSVFSWLHIRLVWRPYLYLLSSAKSTL